MAMIEKDKKLLLQDLFARLPYGLMVKVTDTYDKNYNRVGLLIGIQNTVVVDCNGTPFLFSVDGVSLESDITEIKPFLRPLSSMTEEEKVEYCDLQDRFLCSSQYPVTNAYELFDWLNAHHFDYRGMIEAGLALEAPEGMYNIK